MLRFISPLIVVEDITVSRDFYENCLGLKVRYDFGVDVQFEGDFSIHEKAHFEGLLGQEGRFAVSPRSNDGELYFEADEIEAVEERLKQAGVEFIHEVIEQPWGQRAMRVYDPDGHILEIGEPFDAMARRFYRQGMTVEWIAEKTGMPVEEIERMLKERK